MPQSDCETRQRYAKLSQEQRNIIDSLTKDRELRFFSLTYARQNNFKSTMPNADNEGVCFIYIKELEEKNAIR